MCILLLKEWLFIREEGAEEALEEILPDLTQFCSYLSDFVLTEVMVGEDEQDAAIQVMEREFITNQLLSIILVYDLSDEVRHYCYYLFVCLFDCIFL